MTFKRIIATLLLVGSSSFVLLGNGDKIDPLPKIKTLTAPEQLSSAEIGGARIEAMQKSPEWALDAVALLVTAEHQDDYLELLWWRSNHPNVRMLIVAAFKCRTLEDRADVPLFESYSARFAKSEAEQRLKEVEFMQANLIEFARALKQLTFGLPRCSTLHKQYASVVAAIEAKR